MQIAVIGAGAAGCFAAIELKRRLPDAEITVYEAQNRALAKVAITGGGRCNLTNSFAEVKSAETVYPRGARLMKRLPREFSHRDAWQWFETKVCASLRKAMNACSRFRKMPWKLSILYSTSWNDWE